MGSSFRLTLVKAAKPAKLLADKPARQMAGKRSGKYKMKGFVRVTDNDWSNNGTGRPGAICFALHGASRAQGVKKRCQALTGCCQKTFLCLQHLLINTAYL